MTMMPPSFPTAADSAPVAEHDPLEQHWAALNDAAVVVAAIAGITPSVARAPAEFAGALRSNGGWRERLAREAVGDLVAVMEPGLAALLSSCERGADARPAAHALHAEYERACAALMGLLPN